ncbi:unnamed protein product [Amoebophrya sp. A120]|nr:unnamed protein product [Amoebophrya sp. A120]|eukprot:GSA120T00015921001.1
MAGPWITRWPRGGDAHAVHVPEGEALQRFRGFVEHLRRNGVRVSGDEEEQRRPGELLGEIRAHLGQPAAARPSHGGAIREECEGRRIGAPPVFLSRPGAVGALLWGFRIWRAGAVVFIS